MADYAGAVAAIKARLAAGWTTTRIEYVNETPVEPWPPVDANSNPEPWVMVEVVGVDATQTSVGLPGSNWHIDDGLIHIHVFVPKKSGTSNAFQYAVTIGEIFRNAEFYNATAGHAVRTWTPRVDGGGDGAEGLGEGNWFRVTVTIPFEYIHLA